MDWNIRCKVKVSWNFWSFWQSDLLLLWSIFTETSSSSINCKSRCILCDKNSTRDVTNTYVDIVYGNQRDFLVHCTVTSFYKRNNYIVVNLVVVVHSAKDCCPSNIKLWVPKKVVLFISLSFTLALLNLTLNVHIYVHTFIYTHIYAIKTHTHTHTYIYICFMNVYGPKVTRICAKNNIFNNTSSNEIELQKKYQRHKNSVL